MVVDTGNSTLASGTTSTMTNSTTGDDEHCRNELIRRFNIHYKNHHAILHSDRAHTPGRPYQRSFKKREVDSSRLCEYGNTGADWEVNPVDSMKLESFVIRTETIRKDMATFRNLDSNSMGKLWPVFTRYHPWFKIPDSIPVAHSFARDESDVLYLDHMYNLVELAASRKVHLIGKDLPLFYLRDSLLGRRWNMFSQHADITKAIAFWSSFRLWIPHDSVELSMNNTVAILGESHPDIFDDWNVFRFPAGVPAPAPPSVFYFYDRIKSASGQEKTFWKSVVEFEYALIYLACW